MAAAIIAELEAELSERSQIFNQRQSGVGLALHKDCIDLSPLSWLSVATKADKQIVDEADPFEFELLNLQPAAVPGGTVTANIRIKNISEFTTVKAGWVTIIAPNSSTWSPYVDIDLQPGEEIVEKAFFTASSGSLVAGEGNFTSNYDPETERDWEGVDQLLEHQENAWGKAFPYGFRELCLTGYGNCPLFMWNVTNPVQQQSSNNTRSKK